MNLTSATQVKSLLAKYEMHPKKRLGQNFLIDRNVLDRILEASGIGCESRVLEIGPGLGVVTRELAARAEKVVCVEVDRDFDPILHEVLSDQPNVEIVIADFLKLDLPEFIGNRGEGEWTVIANLPYYITTPILTKLIDHKQHFGAIMLMVQREVAARLRASAGSDEYGSITVFTQYHCTIESVMKVSRNVFYPIPDVDSELVKLTIRENPAVDVKNEALFFAIVKAAFGKRRKTLLNALSSSEDLRWDRARVEKVLSSAGIDSGRRGETLNLAEFAAIANAAE